MAKPPEKTGSTAPRQIAPPPLSQHLREFASRPDGFVMCFSCHQLSPAREVHVHEMRRTEGASDPADTLAVVGMTCPRCDARGTLVVNYGPEITLDDAVVLRALEH